MLNTAYSDVLANSAPEDYKMAAKLAQTYGPTLRARAADELKQVEKRYQDWKRTWETKKPKKMVDSIEEEEDSVMKTLQEVQQSQKEFKESQKEVQESQKEVQEILLKLQNLLRERM